MKRGRKAHQRILTYNTIVGDATALTEGKYPMCEKCHVKVKTCVLSLVQHGFEFDRETDVFHCPKCGEYNSYTYDIAFEVNENGN